jgi:hypothetical protein
MPQYLIALIRVAPCRNNPTQAKRLEWATQAFVAAKEKHRHFYLNLPIRVSGHDFSRAV